MPDFGGIRPIFKWTRLLTKTQSQLWNIIPPRVLKSHPNRIGEFHIEGDAFYVNQWRELCGQIDICINEATKIQLERNEHKETRGRETQYGPSKSQPCKKGGNKTPKFLKKPSKKHVCCPMWEPLARGWVLQPPEGAPIVAWGFASCPVLVLRCWGEEAIGKEKRMHLFHLFLHKSEIHRSQWVGKISRRGEASIMGGACATWKNQSLNVIMKWYIKNYEAQIRSDCEPVDDGFNWSTFQCPETHITVKAKTRKWIKITGEIKDYREKMINSDCEIFNFQF